MALLRRGVRGSRRTIFIPRSSAQSASSAPPHAEKSLSSLAQEAGLSSARLSRLFKAQTGFAMVDFRNRIRIERFLQLYGTGQRHTMLDAALESGFGSYPQFHRVFTRAMGLSPGEYRRQTAN